MKSRITTYLLVIAAFAVWGVVAWKILFPRQTLPDAIVPKAVERETWQSDGYSLSLDYEDPFLKGTEALELSESSEHARQRPAPEQVSISLDGPPVRYAGTISAGGKTLGLFEHGGLLSSLALGEAIEDYTLTSLYADSVRFTKGGMVFTVNIQR